MTSLQTFGVLTRLIPLRDAKTAVISSSSSISLWLKSKWTRLFHPSSRPHRVRDWIPFRATITFLSRRHAAKLVTSHLPIRMFPLRSTSSRFSGHVSGKLEFVNLLPWSIICARLGKTTSVSSATNFERVGVPGNEVKKALSFRKSRTA